MRKLQLPPCRNYYYFMKKSESVRSNGISHWNGEKIEEICIIDKHISVCSRRLLESLEKSWALKCIANTDLE